MKIGAFSFGSREPEDIGIQVAIGAGVVMVATLVYCAWKYFKENCGGYEAAPLRPDEISYQTFSESDTSKEPSLFEAAKREEEEKKSPIRLEKVISPPPPVDVTSPEFPTFSQLLRSELEEKDQHRKSAAERLFQYVSTLPPNVSPKRAPKEESKWK